MTGWQWRLPPHPASVRLLDRRCGKSQLWTPDQGIFSFVYPLYCMRAKLIRLLVLSLFGSTTDTRKTFCQWLLVRRIFSPRQVTMERQVQQREPTTGHRKKGRMNGPRKNPNLGKKMARGKRAGLNTRSPHHHRRHPTTPHHTPIPGWSCTHIARRILVIRHRGNTLFCHAVTPIVSQRLHVIKWQIQGSFHSSFWRSQENQYVASMSSFNAFVAT